MREVVALLGKDGWVTILKCEEGVDPPFTILLQAQTELNHLCMCSQSNAAFGSVRTQYILHYSNLKESLNDPLKLLLDPSLIAPDREGQTTFVIAEFSEEDRFPVVCGRTTTKRSATNPIVYINVPQYQENALVFVPALQWTLAVCPCAVRAFDLRSGSEQTMDFTFAYNICIADCPSQQCVLCVSQRGISAISYRSGLGVAILIKELCFKPHVDLAGIVGPDNDTVTLHILYEHGEYTSSTITFKGITYNQASEEIAEESAAFPSFDIMPTALQALQEQVDRIVKLCVPIELELNPSLAFESQIDTIADKIATSAVASIEQRLVQRLERDIPTHVAQAVQRELARVPAQWTQGLQTALAQAIDTEKAKMQLAIIHNGIQNNVMTTCEKKFAKTFADLTDTMRKEVCEAHLTGVTAATRLLNQPRGQQLQDLMLQDSEATHKQRNSAEDSEKKIYGTVLNADMLLSHNLDQLQSLWVQQAKEQTEADTRHTLALESAMAARKAAEATEVTEAERHGTVATSAGRPEDGRSNPETAALLKTIPHAQASKGQETQQAMFDFLQALRARDGGRAFDIAKANNFIEAAVLRIVAVLSHEELQSLNASGQVDQMYLRRSLFAILNKLQGGKDTPPAPTVQLLQKAELLLVPLYSADQEYTHLKILLRNYFLSNATF